MKKMQPWQGEWGDNQQTMNVFVEFVDIPFHSELFNDLFIIAIILTAINNVHRNYQPKRKMILW